MVDQNGKLVVKYKYDAYCNNNLVMYVNPTGDIAFLALVIGKIIGACIDFGTSAYIVPKDGSMFNGDVKWYDYLGATAGVTFAVELTINGVQIIGVARIVGLIVMMVKTNGKSGEYTVKHIYSNDYYLTHFHIYSNDIIKNFTSSGLD